MSATARAKMSAAAKARASNRVGKKHTPEARAKISQRTRERTPRGAECHSFIDGLSREREDLRSTPEGRAWRFDVMSRDGFMCCHCGDDRGSNLEAHHRKPWATHPHLRFELSNGVTLCKPCHWLAHAYEGCVPGLN